jgi:hypothetical protein
MLIARRESELPALRIVSSRDKPRVYNTLAENPAFDLR